MSIKVQDNAQIPPSRRKRSASKYPFATMAVDQWFFVPDEAYEGGAKANSVRAAMYRQNAIGAANNVRFVARSVHAVHSPRKGWTLVEDETAENAVLGVGVWREA